MLWLDLGFTAHAVSSGSGSWLGSFCCLLVGSWRLLLALSVYGAVKAGSLFRDMSEKRMAAVRSCLIVRWLWLSALALARGSWLWPSVKEAQAASMITAVGRSVPQCAL